MAVLPVIFFHAGFGLFSGGFVGVDVFFVISGYLITTVILNEKQAGTFTLRRFYERRARRILPALFLVMFCCLPFAWLWMLPVEMEKFSRSLVAVSVFASNILFRKESGYFDSAAELKPLLHTWSLGIEEQYYVLFPLFVMLAWKLGRRFIAAILLVVLVVSLAFAEYKIAHKPAAAFYLLPSRGWELLLGALVAFYLQISRARSANAIKEAGGILGIALIAYAVFVFDEHTPFPAVYALVPTLGAALIILCATPQTLVGKLLGSKPLVGVGLISYSAYLWHQPLFAFARISSAEKPSSVLFLALVLASLLFAYFSWKYVETPFRSSARVSRRAIWSFALCGSAFFIALGALGNFTKGYEQYFISHRLNAAEQEVYALIKKHTGGDMYMEMGDDGDCNFWVRNVDDTFTVRFQACSKKYGKALVVLGDSHAMNIYNAFYRAGGTHFLVGVSQGACRPQDNAPTCHYDGYDKFLAENKAAVAQIFYNQSGAYLLSDAAGQVNRQELFAEGAEFNIADDNIQKAAAYLDKLSTMTKVVWLGPFAEAQFDFHNIRKVMAEGFSIRPHIIDIFAHLDEALAHQFATSPHAFSYVSLGNILQIKPDFLKQGDCITYRDSDHFSVCGEKIVGDKMKESLLQRSK